MVFRYITNQREGMPFRRRVSKIMKYKRKSEKAKAGKEGEYLMTSQLNAHEVVLLWGPEWAEAWCWQRRAFWWSFLKCTSGEALGLLRLTFGLLKSGYPNYPGHPEKPVITTLALDLSFGRSTFFLVANALIVLCLRIVLLKPCFISRPNSSKTCFRILIPFV